MEITKRLRERFCKDSNINIKIFDEPYFSNRLELYDRVMPERKIIYNYNQFLSYISTLTDESAFFDEYNSIKDRVIEDIKSNTAYQAFNTLDFMKNDIRYYLPYSEREIYKDYNVGKYFVSIDMKKANFTSLRCFDPNIFHNATTWEEFLDLFTDSEYIKSSKYIRQIIMGNCNPGRQITYEKYLMGCVVKELGYTNIVSVKNDEIILDVSNMIDSSDYESIHHMISMKVNNVIDKVFPNLDLRVELFRIELLFNSNGYKRVYYDGVSWKHEYKCLSSYEAPLVFRRELHEEVTDDDKMFVFEGKLAKFL